MKKFLLTIVITGYIIRLNAQTNCLVFKDAAHIKACELYNEAINHPQGSKESQQLFIQSINSCPTYAPSLHEMSVPYLKRGDFHTWKILIDKAVNADPEGYLGTRGWCYFKFLRDYPNALKDLKRLCDLKKGQPGYSGDGDYNLLIVMGLCEREMGNYKQAISYFDQGIKSRPGLYDYLHRGVTKLRMGDYKGAMADIEKEIAIYKKLADAYYYVGMIQKHLEDNSLARLNFNRAKDLFTKTGYHLNDPYCELQDQVYLSDIEQQLQKL